MSVTIPEKSKKHCSFVGSCLVSSVFRNVRSTQKEQYEQPQSGSGARRVAKEKRRGSCRAQVPCEWVSLEHSNNANDE